MMEVTHETLSKTVTEVKWNVVIPRSNDKSTTKNFTVNNARWKLRLVSNIACSNAGNYDEKWIMWLDFVGNFATDPFIKKFLLAVYIRHNKNDIFLNAVTIACTSISNQIWVEWCSSFKANYPRISAAERLLFILDFHPDNRIHVNSPTEHKASGSTACAEIHPCLESLSLDMSHQMDESADADVQLTCGDLTVRAHKLILSARSEVFRTMLRSDMVEGRKGVIEIVDMEPKVLEIFIRYVYAGTLPVLTEDAVLSLYEAADKYKIDGLRKRCRCLLTTILSPENALGILVVADAHDDKDLKSRVLSYVVDKNIPRKDNNWLKFCNDYPKLVVEVFNCQLFSGSS